MENQVSSNKDVSVAKSTLGTNKSKGSVPKILVIEPDSLYLTGIAAVLDSTGYRCFLARDVDVAVEATASTQFDLIVFSINENIEKAVADAKRLKVGQKAIDLPIVFLAPRLDVEWIGPLNGVGGVYCLPKPFEPEVLMELVDKAIWMPHVATARIAPPKAHFSNEWVRLS